MNEQDQDRVERVLAVLGRVDAPAGLVQRVLARIEQAEPVRGWWEGLRGAAVAGGMTLAVLAVGLGLWLRPARRPIGLASAPAVVLRQTDAGAALQSAAVEPVRVESQGRRRRTTVVRIEASTGLEQDGDEDLLAAEETRAPSLLAPAIGLTAEERMLARAARRSDAAELAMVEARWLAKRSAEEREFQEYFAGPPLLVTAKVPNTP